MIPRERPAGQALDWSRTDRTEMKPGVAERKWEVDSLCYVLRLAHDYWEFTGDTEPFDGTWAAAAKTIVATFRQQQRTSGPGPYRFQRRSDQPTETTLAGVGVPTRKTGLIHSAFRPSDDACTFPCNIPGNLFAVATLRELAEMATKSQKDAFDVVRKRVEENMENFRNFGKKSD